jgi:glyoxylase-like metal-dependent hydrolase (beta-lactamase superfamily II)
MFGRLLTRYISTIKKSPKVDCLYHEDTGTCCYIVACPDTGKAAVIDPVLDYDSVNHKISKTHADKVISAINSYNYSLSYIIETHIHADHITGAQVLKKAFPDAKTIIGANVIAVQKTFGEMLNLKNVSLTGEEFDILIKDNDTFSIGNINVKAISTPGHTPACMVYVIGDSVFTGDTIFMPDFGTARCDFPGGSAELLYESIQKIFELPDSYKVFVGHDYGTDTRKPLWETTIRAEKLENKQLNINVSKEQFLNWRKARDSKLSLPKLIMQSLQVNLRNGAMPEPESNGVSYFKLPLTY